MKSIYSLLVASVLVSSSSALADDFRDTYEKAILESVECRHEDARHDFSTTGPGFVSSDLTDWIDGPLKYHRLWNRFTENAMRCLHRDDKNYCLIAEGDLISNGMRRLIDVLKKSQQRPQSPFARSASHELYRPKWDCPVDTSELSRMYTSDSRNMGQFIVSTQRHGQMGCLKQVLSLLQRADAEEQTKLLMTESQLMATHLAIAQRIRSRSGFRNDLASLAPILDVPEYVVRALTSLVTQGNPSPGEYTSISGSTAWGKLETTAHKYCRNKYDLVRGQTQIQSLQLLSEILSLLEREN